MKYSAGRLTEESWFATGNNFKMTRTFEISVVEALELDSKEFWKLFRALALAVTWLLSKGDIVNERRFILFLSLMSLHRLAAYGLLRLKLLKTSNNTRGSGRRHQEHI